MTEMKKKQQKTLNELEAKVSSKWSEWLTAYRSAESENSSVILVSPSQLNTLYTELVELREQRNALLAEYRALGVNI